MIKHSLFSIRVNINFKKLGDFVQNFIVNIPQEMKRIMFLYKNLKHLLVLINILKFEMSLHQLQLKLCFPFHMEQIL